MQAIDKTFRTFAENTIKKDYKLTKIQKKLDDTDMSAFWARVEEIVEIVGL